MSLRGHTRPSPHCRDFPLIGRPATPAMADSVESHGYAHETRRVDTSVDPAGLGACATAVDRRDGDFHGIWRPDGGHGDSVKSRARVRRSGLRRAACALGDGLVCPSVDTPDRPPTTATSLALGGRQRRPWRTPLEVTLRTPLAHARGSIRDDFHSLWWARTAMATPLEVALGCADPGFGAQRACWGTVSCVPPRTHQTVPPLPRLPSHLAAGNTGHGGLR